MRAQKGVFYRHDLFNCELVRLTASIGWLTAVSHEKVPSWVLLARSVKESQKQMKHVHAQHDAQMTALMDEQEEKLKQIDSGIVSLMVAIELVEGTDASSPVASNSSDTDSTRDADDDDSIIKAPVTPVKTNMKKRSPYSTRGTGGCLHQAARLEGLEALCLGAGTSDGNVDETASLSTYMYWATCHGATLAPPTPVASPDSADVLTSLLSEDDGALLADFLDGIDWEMSPDELEATLGNFFV